MTAAVDLLRCEKCSLTWVQGTEPIPGACPACSREYTVPRGPVLVAGIQVPVKSVMAYGSIEGLLDFRVRRGLEVLRLGNRCEHGWMSTHLCPTCNQQ
jgi:hypothetical protein